MSTPEDATPGAPSGLPLMLSYNKLLSLETGMVEVKAMLQAALALRGEVDRIKDDMKDHDIRLVALEQIQAIGLAKKSVWDTLRTYLYGFLSAVAALVAAMLAGGGATLLPKLWGG